MIYERDPRIRALANQAVREIKALTNAHNEQIASIYRRFLAQAAAIRASADSLRGSSADSSPRPNSNERIVRLKRS